MAQLLLLEAQEVAENSDAATKRVGPSALIQPKIGSGAAPLKIPCESTGESNIGTEGIFSVEFALRAGAKKPELPGRFWSLLATLAPALQIRTLKQALEHYDVTIEAVKSKIHLLAKEFGDSWVFGHAEALRVLWGAIHPPVIFTPTS